MAGDIVPIELVLTEGNTFTLWAPRWREGDDEWEAFLGLEDDMYGFDSVAELVAFVRSGDENDLDEHPAWHTVAGLAASELRPAADKIYDLISVPELAAEDPTPEVIAELENTLDIVRMIGEVCELTTITKFFNGNPMLGAVTIGTQNFYGRDGQELWAKIGTLIDKHWDNVVDAVDEVITSPDVDKTAVANAEAELEAAASAEDEDEPDVADDDLEVTGAAAAAALADDEDDSSDDDDDEADEDLDDEEEDDVDDDDFWSAVGIDPIRIVTDADELFTLRCYLGDDPVFLGKQGKIYVFSSARALARFLADSDDNDLATVSTFEEVTVAATDGSLEIDVHDENVYVLPGITEDIADGPKRIDREQLDLAVELLTDAADFADDDAVSEALATSTPLGWFIDYSLNPDPKRLAPSGPFDNESEQWRALQHDFENRLERKG